jgi:hypothetical protein
MADGVRHPPPLVMAVNPAIYDRKVAEQLKLCRKIRARVETGNLCDRASVSLSKRAILPQALLTTVCRVTLRHPEVLTTRLMAAVALDLFRTPAGIGVTHVRWWLDRWDELQSSVAKTGDHDDASNNVAECAVLEYQATNEKVDWDVLACQAGCE